MSAHAASLRSFPMAVSPIGPEQRPPRGRSAESESRDRFAGGALASDLFRRVTDTRDQLSKLAAKKYAAAAT